MNKLEELKAVIVKANPSIMNLEFGCEIEYKKKVLKVLTVRDVTYLYVLNDDDLPEHIPLRVDLFKILGRPIRLADVLLALGADGFVDKEQENNIMNCLVRWEYTDDNLTHQSPETINFLHKILVGEKG